MKITSSIIASVVVLIGITVWAQVHLSFTNQVTTEAFKPMYWRGATTTHGNFPKLELRNGKLYVTHSTHEPCFAATIPGCEGHGKTWRDVYSASNGVVVLERTINQVLVTHTNITTTQTYEWPE